MIYDREYGDNRLCKCGHPYYRHFDTYDGMKNVGCKYCGWECKGFDAADGENPIPIQFSDEPLERVDWLRQHEEQFGDFGLIRVDSDNQVRVFGCDVAIVLMSDGTWLLEERGSE